MRGFAGVLGVVLAATGVSAQSRIPGSDARAGDIYGPTGIPGPNPSALLVPQVDTLYVDGRMVGTTGANTDMITGGTRPVETAPDVPVQKVCPPVVVGGAVRAGCPE